MAEPLVIVATPRSGTHSIERALGMVPGVRCDGEVLNAVPGATLASWTAEIAGDKVHAHAVAVVMHGGCCGGDLALLLSMAGRVLLATRRGMHKVGNASSSSEVTSTAILPHQGAACPSQPSPEAPGSSCWWSRRRRAFPPTGATAGFSRTSTTRRSRLQVPRRRRASMASQPSPASCQRAPPGHEPFDQGPHLGRVPQLEEIGQAARLEPQHDALVAVTAVPAPEARPLSARNLLFAPLAKTEAKGRFWDRSEGV